MERNTTLDATDALREFASYPFDSDIVYQQGLASITMGGALNRKSEQDREETLRQSRVFYFNRRTGHSLSVEDTRIYEEQLSTTSPGNINSASDQTSFPTQVQLEVPPHAVAPNTMGPEETRVLTFSELKELIETGRTDQIPNNKAIPNVLNDTPPSEAILLARKKPWELGRGIDK